MNNYLKKTVVCESTGTTVPLWVEVLAYVPTKSLKLKAWFDEELIFPVLTRETQVVKESDYAYTKYDKYSLYNVAINCPIGYTPVVCNQEKELNNLQKIVKIPWKLQRVRKSIKMFQHKLKHNKTNLRWKSRV